MPMLRLTLAALVSISGAVSIIAPSHAGPTWQEHRKKSSEYAKKEQWTKACRQAVWAGAGMASDNALSTEYMAKIGKRCTEAAR